MISLELCMWLLPVSDPELRDITVPPEEEEEEEDVILSPIETPAQSDLSEYGPMSTLKTGIEAPVFSPTPSISYFPNPCTPSLAEWVCLMIDCPCWHNFELKFWQRLILQQARLGGSTLFQSNTLQDLWWWVCNRCCRRYHEYPKHQLLNDRLRKPRFRSVWGRITIYGHTAYNRTVYGHTVGPYMGTSC